VSLWVGHANVHNNLPAVRELLAAGRRRTRYGLDSAGINEGHRILDDLADLDGFRLEVGRAFENPRAGETPLLTARRHPSIGSGAFRIARESVPDRVAGLPRVATVSTYTHRDTAVGDVAHVNVHLHWIGPAADHPEVDRVVETAAASRALIRLVAFLDSLDLAVVVTGDVNVRRRVDTPGWLDPWEAFERAGLKARTVGPLDAVAWSPRLLELERLDVIPADELGSDHPGAIARFEGRRHG
jgi:hypothetical protein